MATISETIEFLTRHNYIMRVHQVENGCDLYFPNKKYNPKPDVNIAKFRAKLGKYPGLYCNDTFASAPEYAIKLLMSCFILKWAMAIKYSCRFLILVDDEGEKLPIGSDITDVIHIKLDKEQQDKQEKLIKLFGEYLMAGLPESYLDIADEYGVKEGFVLAKRIFLENEK